MHTHAARRSPAPESGSDRRPDTVSLRSWRSSPACPSASSRSSRLAATSPRPTPDRWSRRRTCRSACGTSSRAATPSSSATAPRSGCSAGAIVVGALAAQPAALVHRRGGAVAADPAHPRAPGLLRHPRTAPGPGRAPRGPLGHLARPPGPARCSMPWPIWPYRAHRRVVRRAGTIEPVPPDAGRRPRRTSPRRSP